MTRLNELIQKSFLVTLWVLPLYLPFVVFIASRVGSIYVLSAWKELVLFTLLLALIKPILNLRNSKDALLKILNLTIVVYVLLSALYVFKSDSLFEFVAGFLFSTRFLLFFIVAQVLAVKVKNLPDRLSRIVVITGTILAAIAIIQALILPPTILQYIGYEPLGVETPGFPPAVTTLGEVDDFIRPQATLRGPNPLGAFLVLPFCLLFLRLLDKKNRYKFHPIAWLAIGLALLFTFSRSSWIAAFIGVTGILLYYYRAKLRSLKPAWIVAGVIGLVLFSTVALSNKTVRVIVLREETSSSTRLSDDIRGSLTKEAWEDVINNPLGRGPGNAGPVSVLDSDDRGRIAENYFLQVAQETGWLGLLLFVVIHILLLVKLWTLRQEPLALVAFTTLCGLTLANLTLHTWSDETVSILWWSFAGAIIGTYTQKKVKRG